MEKNIYLIGDTGEYNLHTYQIFNNINNDCSEDDCIIMLGDNFYPTGINSEYNYKWTCIKDIKLKIPIYPVMGNHDYLSIDPYAQFKHTTICKDYQWNMYNFYYSITVNNCDIFFIDTQILQPNYTNLNEKYMDSILYNFHNVRKNMINWLNLELSKSNRRKIVVGHYPLATVGIYKNNKVLYDILIPIFTKYNVELYISGHEHSLQINNILDKDTNKPLLKQLVSGSGSSIYNYFSHVENTDNYIKFLCHGHIKLTTYTTNSNIEITIIDEKNNILHTEII